MVEATVTDTHPLIFHAAASRRMGKRAAAVFEAAERRAAVVYVPAAVLWECGLLALVGRVDLQRPLQEFCMELFSNPARHLQLPLLSRDAEIRRSGLVEVIW